jgi:hypothetical protein
VDTRAYPGVEILRPIADRSAQAYEQRTAAADSHGLKRRFREVQVDRRLIGVQ